MKSSVRRARAWYWIYRGVRLAQYYLAHLWHSTDLAVVRALIKTK